MMIENVPLSMENVHATKERNCSIYSNIHELSAKETMTREPSFLEKLARKELANTETEMEH